MSRPDIIAGIDFESFSEINLKKTGSARYAEDPTTESICQGWYVGDMAPRVWAPSATVFALREAELLAPNVHSHKPRELFDHIRAGGLVYAWNVEFEIGIWEWIMVKRHGWEPIPRDQWRDTQALAASFAFPSNLEGCGEAMGLDILKDKNGTRLIHKLSKPRRPSKHNDATRWTPLAVPQDYADFLAYCAQDCEAERAILKALPVQDFDATEGAIWQGTKAMNLRGWTVDIDSASRMLDILATHKERSTDEIQELTGGEVTTGNQLDRMLNWLADRDVFLDNMQADTIEEALRGELPADARRLLELRQVLSKASVGKYEAMRVRVCSDGTVKNNIKHHGTSTGRDAGAGLQIQNFVRGAISKTDHGVEVAFRALRTNNPLDTIELVYGSPTTFASLLTRSHLTAAPGHELFCADFSQIENRLAAWHADCEYGLDIFRQGLDEYKKFAAQFYGVEYGDVTDAQRQHAKGAILLFIFGGGEGALVAQAERYGNSLDLKEAKRLKRVYRKELYPEIADLWEGLEKAAQRCVKTGETTRYNRVEFTLEDGFLMMLLPSGRKLAYYDPKVELKLTPWGKKKPTITHMGVDGPAKKWQRIKLIPGRIFENLVQATARDAMMHGARNTAAAGFQLVGRIHDELASQLLRALSGSLEEYCRLMADAPGWLDGVPVVAEGWRGFRFRK